MLTHVFFSMDNNNHYKCVMDLVMVVLWGLGEYSKQFAQYLFRQKLYFRKLTLFPSKYLPNLSTYSGQNTLGKIIWH